MSPTQFRAALDSLDLSQVGAARLFGYADGRAIRRYISGERGIPPPVAILLRLMLTDKITADDIATAKK